MDWKIFVERFLINHEEKFRLKYKNYFIDIERSPKSKKYIYYIREYIENPNLLVAIKNKNNYLEYDEFDSPEELLKKFRIENKSLEEIWNELDWGAMSWDEFIERYLTNHEEFSLKYRKYIIDLEWSPNGKKYAYYIKEYDTHETFFRMIKNRHKYLEYDEFDSPEELLEKFRIENKSLEEIWNELDWYI